MNGRCHVLPGSTPVSGSNSSPPCKDHGAHAAGLHGHIDQQAEAKLAEGKTDRLPHHPRVRGHGHDPQVESVLPTPRSERKLLTSSILGMGTFVPERTLKNSDLERMVTTSDEWILSRTGIRERHIVAPGQATSDLAIEAGRRALTQAQIDPEDLELIVLATATPDQITPSSACFVQRGLGAQHAAGYDLNAACSGFIHALMTGHHLVAAGAFGNALIIGADALSSITDYTDRESCILFGDGAGAVVIGPSTGRKEILDHIVGMDGTGSELIKVEAGGSRYPASHSSVDHKAHYLKLQGRRVFRFAVEKIPLLVHQLLDRHGLCLDDISLLIPHQANRRIIEAAVRALEIDEERVLVNIERYGNTSNASIPLALDEAARTGRLEPGGLVILVAFGAGLTWGATLLRW